MSVDSVLGNTLSEYNTAATDGMGSSVPGFQASFHQAMSSKASSLGIDDPLSVAAPANNFFVVQNPDGSRAYTRAGNFHILDGKLLTSKDQPVLGFPEGLTGGSLVPITVPAGTPEGWVNIAADGTVSIADPKLVAEMDAGHPGTTPAVQPGEAKLPADDGSSRQHSIYRRGGAAAALAATGATTASIPGADGDDVPNPALMDAVAGNRAPAGIANQYHPAAPVVMPIAGQQLAQPGGATTAGTASQPDVPAPLDAVTGVKPAAGAAVDADGDALPRAGMTVDLNGNPAALGTAAVAANRSSSISNIQAGKDPRIEPGNIAGVAMSPHGSIVPTVEGSAANAANPAQIPHFQAGVVAGEARGNAAPAIGKPVGRIAVAQFPIGTVVDNNGVPSDPHPLAIGVPKNGNFAAIRTNSRDLGSIDILSAMTHIAEVGNHLNAVMTAEQSRLNRAKKAMDLIK